MDMGMRPLPDDSASAFWLRVIIVFIFFAALARFSAAQTPPPAPVRPAGSPCEIGSSPAATLLVPYFEVDSSSDTGMDTLVGITNISKDPLVVHATVWNVDAWAVFAFNIYLTGYDVVTFSMRQILVHGNLPNNGCTSSAYRFTTRYIDCNGDGQYFNNTWTAGDGLFTDAGLPTDIACYATVSAATLADWQCKLSIGSYDGWNPNFVGYLTLDSALTCTGALPDAIPRAYFALNTLDTDGNGRPDHGVLENGNTLMGDIFYYDHDNLQSDGVPAVQIEAWGEGNFLDGHTWGTKPTEWAEQGISTFYYKYEYQAHLLPYDARESLPVVWAFRYIGNDNLNGGTLADVWRSANPGFEHWFVHDGPCTWEGMGSAYTTLYNPYGEYHGYPYLTAYLSFDEEENMSQSTPPNLPSPPQPPWTVLQLASQRDYIETPNWPLVAYSGWFVIFFSNDNDYFGPGFDNSFDQAWVNVRYSALDRYTVSTTAFAVTGGCAVTHNDRAHSWAITPTH